MDLSVSIAMGSAAQIALFVAPVLVLASYFIGPTPMDLQFWPGHRTCDVGRRCPVADGLCGFCHDVLFAAAGGRIGTRCQRAIELDHCALPR
jgi:hypothetical protein